MSEIPDSTPTNVSQNAPGDSNSAGVAGSSNGSVLQSPFADTYGIQPGAELRAKQASDYTGQSTEIRSLAGDLSGSTHEVKQSYDYVILTSDLARGYILAQILINALLDPGSTALAYLHEMYLILSVAISVMATSPFGTSSGGMQIAPFYDPANMVFDDGATEANINKLVRQQGSVALRPRDTTYLEMHFDGKPRFTTASGSIRWNTYAGFVLGVRDPAAVADQARFTVTITTKIQFMRTSLLTVSSLYQSYTSLDVTAGVGGIFFTILESHFSSQRIRLRFDTPLLLSITYTDKEGLTKNTIVRCNDAQVAPDIENKRYYIPHHPENYSLPKTCKLDKMVVMAKPINARIFYKQHQTTAPISYKHEE